MISVILPTYNEAANLPTIVDFLDGALRDMPHEIIVVDDNSPDGTWRVAEGLSAKYASVRVIRRMGKRGLSSAVVDGFDMAVGEKLVVMDADGQHDPSLLPAVLGALEQGSDIAIGSRYVDGGSVGDWVTDRRIISSLGTLFARLVSRVPVSDPLGGFFALKRSLYRTVRPHLHPTGFKILLEILAFVPTGTRLTEVPLQFRMRQHGESKLSMRVHMEFFLQILRLLLLQIPARIRRHGSILFWGTSVIIAAVLFLRILPLAHLRHAEVRASLRQALVTIADHEGWLLSDVSVRRVGLTSATIVHQEHGRENPGPKTCELTYSPPSLTCDESI